MTGPDSTTPDSGHLIYDAIIHVDMSVRVTDSVDGAGSAGAADRRPEETE
ncbi:hypothetical protein [Halorubrum halophilum]|nr:hypothetical protein [Halorubrum halophilum]